MTPEPSNEYQKLVEAVKAALDSDLCRQALVQGTKYVADTETGLRDASMYIALDELARAALSALKLAHAGDDGWQFVATISGRQCQIDSVSELLRLINGRARIETIAGQPCPRRSQSHV